jgi:putative addiction module killer protein
MVPYMLPLQRFDVREYLDQSGRSPFAAWSDGLNREAAAKMAVGLIRLQQGHLSMSKGIGPGLYEYRIDFGPGYRIYFGRDGGHLVILLGGGTKKRQRQDIKTALARWADYKLRRPKEK